MKHLILVLFIGLSISAHAQFPNGTDTLRNYNNRFIDNNAQKAFTNLRLHNLLAGMINHMDTISFGGVITLGMDTAFMFNDSLYVYRKGGVFHQFVIRGASSGAGGIGQIYRVPYNDGAGHFTNDSNFKFDKSIAADASRLIVGPTSISSGGHSKINATSDNMNALALTSYGSGLNNIIARRARGPISAPTALLNGDDLFSISGRGYDGTGFTSTSRTAIYSQATQDWTGTNQGTRLYFRTTSNDSSNAPIRMIIDDSLQVSPVLASGADSIAALRLNANGLHTLIKIPFNSDGFIQNQFSTAQSASFYVDSLGRIRYLKVDSFATFEPIASVPYAEGRMFYDNSNKTFTILDDISATSVQLAQENYVRARNNTGVTINDASAVYISGSIGQNPTVSLAKADAESTSRTIGLATHNISNNTTGKITVFGLVNDINTSAFSEGDRLFLSATTSGTLTNVEPTGTNLSVFVGYCLLSHVSNGKILVDPQKSISKDIATASLTANGNYTQNWNHKQLFIDTVSNLRILSNEADQILPTKTAFLLRSTPSWLTSPMELKASLRKTNNSADSAAMGIIAQSGGNMKIYSQSTDGTTKESSIQLLPPSVTVTGKDSIFIVGAIPAATADSFYAPAPFSGIGNKMIKVPASAIAGTPAGSNTQIQYNNSGSFGASSFLTWDNSLQTMTVTSDGGEDNGVINVVNGTSQTFMQGFGFAALSSSSLISPQISLTNNLSKQLQMTITGGSGLATISTNDSMFISSTKQAVTGSTLILRGLDSLRADFGVASKFASADSIVGIVNSIGSGGPGVLANTTRLVKIPQLQRFAQTATTSVSATATETTLIGSGAGSLTIPANRLVAGKTYRLTVRGKFSTDATNPAQMNWRTKFGSTTICATGDKILGANKTDKAYDIHIEVTCRTTGASGTVMAQGMFFTEDGPGADGIENGGFATATIDTTVANTLDFTVDFTDGSAGNSCFAYILIFEEVN